jgi:hypothetical protein
MLLPKMVMSAHYVLAMLPGVVLCALIRAAVGSGGAYGSGAPNSWAPRLYHSSVVENTWAPALTLHK